MTPVLKLHILCLLCIGVSVLLAGCGGGGNTPKPPAPAGRRIDVKTWADGTYALTVDGDQWFAGSPPTFRHRGRVLSASDGSLKLKDTRLTSERATSGDEFQLKEHTWVSHDEAVTMTTRVQVFQTYVVFTQTFPHGAKETSAGNRDDIVSAYPTLTPRWKGMKGVLSFQGAMTGDAAKTGVWVDGIAPSSIASGINGTGPIVLFDALCNTSLVLSPFSNFMAANQKVGQVDPSSLSYGVMGGVTEIPSGYSLSTIVSIGSGVNAAMDSWGDILLKQYGKKRYAYQRDLAMRYLGYSTDNGAYYYYQTEPGKNYEDTLIDIKNNNQSIPYKYVLLDSWWYSKGKNNGVKTWEATPDIFPDGNAGFWNKTQWPTQLHNRMWATDTTYAKQNGGKYNFIMDGSEVSVPYDQQFWNDLIGNKTLVGAFAYEQDWLDTEFDKSKSLGESATLGRTWMIQMDHGAAYANQTIQLCMSYVRHILQSVEMPTVTNARASEDYHPGGTDQWNTGTTALLAHAVGIGPSKDNYWSTRKQNGTHYSPDSQEHHSRLQSAVSTLTNGPVAPSDKNGASDFALIMHCCDASGQLLSADRPATEIDAHFTFAAGFDGVDGNMWSTYATVSGHKFSYVFAVSLNSEYDLKLAELGYDTQDELLAVMADAVSTIPFTHKAPLHFVKCKKDDFQLYIVAPRTGDYTLLGEPDKWISVSSQRFSDLSVSGSVSSVKVHGQAGEEVSVRWAGSNGSIISTTCRFSKAGVKTSEVSAAGARCTSSSSVELIV